MRTKNNGELRISNVGETVTLVIPTVSFVNTTASPNNAPHFVPPI